MNNAAKIWVAIEANAKQIKDFALKSVGGGPDSGNCERWGFLRRRGLSGAGALRALKRKQVIDNLKARFLRVQVKSSNISKKAELQAGIVPQKLADFSGMTGTDVKRHFAAERCVSSSTASGSNSRNF